MADLKRPGDLSRQVPADVKERARKAGVKDFDWYAGRLTSTEGRGFTEVPGDDHRRLRQRAKARRKARRVERKTAVITFMRSRLSTVRPRRTRQARSL